MLLWRVECGACVPDPFGGRQFVFGEQPQRFLGRKIVLQQCGELADGFDRILGLADALGEAQQLFIVGNRRVAQASSVLAAVVSDRRASLAAEFRQPLREHSGMISLALGDHPNAGADAIGSADLGPRRECFAAIGLARTNFVEKTDDRGAFGLVSAAERLESAAAIAITVGRRAGFEPRQLGFERGLGDYSVAVGSKQLFEFKIVAHWVSSTLVGPVLTH